MAITLTLSRQEADILVGVLNGEMGNWIEASAVATDDEDMNRSVLPEQRLAADKARAALKATASLRNRLAQAVKEGGE